MAVTRTLLDSGANGATSNVAVTGVISPAADALVLLACAAHPAGGPAFPTSVTGAGMTWVLVDQQNHDVGNGTTMGLYKAQSATPGSGAVTIQYAAGQDQIDIIWSIVQFDGVDANAVIQSAKTAGNSAAALATLAAFADPGNATYGFIAAGGLGDPFTPGTGFSALHSVSGPATGDNLFTEWRADADTTVDASLNAADPWGVIAVEIKAAVSAPPQIAEPTSTVTAGSWTPVGAVTLHEAVDEITASDADYAVTTVADAMRLGGFGLATPGVPTGAHVVRYRLSSPTSDSMEVALMQGAAQIAAWTHNPAPATPTTFVQTLTQPQVDAISSYPSLEVLFAPSLASAPLPSWLGPEGEWVVVPGGTLDVSGAAWTGPSPGGVSTYTTVMAAWGGACINTKGVHIGGTFVPGFFMIFFGGGHTDYAGNEVYAFGPIDSETPVWARLRDPTIPAPINQAEDAFGNPSSRHSYSSLIYDGFGTENRMLCIGNTSWYQNAGQSGIVHAFDFTVVDPNSMQPWSAISDAGFPSDAAALDETTRVVWSHVMSGSANTIGTYDIATGQHVREIFASPTFGNFSASAAVDSGRKLVAFFGAFGLNFHRYSGSTTLVGDYYTPSTTGVAPPFGVFGLIRDTVNDRFVVWNDDGKTLWFLTPPANNPYQGGDPWVWSSVTPSTGATPGAATAAGTYSKFQFLDAGAYQLYVLCNATNQPVYAFRPGVA